MYVYMQTYMYDIYINFLHLPKNYTIEEDKIMLMRVKGEKKS